MKRLIFATTLCCAVISLLAGCGPKGEADLGAPPPAKVEQEQDGAGFKTAHPEEFPLATAGEHRAAPELTVTGVVNPDVSRSVPAISLASGRVVEVKARLGDTVKKGQLLLRVRSADISGAFSDYRQAVADETLTKTQLERARVLYERGAIAQKDLEVATDVETKARVAREAAIEKLHVLGVTDLDHPPSGIVDIFAPISGVITEQNVTAGAGVKTLDNSPNLFTIANLDSVWIMCDVYENDFPFVHLGEYADVRLNAYPDKVFKGRISNIGPILDPSIRTAKVRLEMQNPGLMRIGMFASATFYGHQEETHAVVPAAAILHLHDRDWVFAPAGGGEFRRIEVVGGKMLPDKLQEVKGIDPGQQVVANALVLQYAAQQDSTEPAQDKKGKGDTQEKKEGENKK
ncbi:MAG: efflux RND transporter periplasmic adaptor subunit [Syntrophorhabdales bacterium]|jgi:cobalt-zinc-cadmium efflux system membrane fusion protein